MEAEGWSREWQRRADPICAAMPPVETFRNIPVAARRGMRDQAVIGGPVWPDAGACERLRQRRLDGPAGPLPAGLSRWTLARRRGPYLWGGSALGHFGHQIAEHASRVLHGIAVHPEARVLLLPGPWIERGPWPGFLVPIMGWLGVPPGRIDMIDGDFVAGRLHAAPQSEQLPSPVATAAYLDLLDLNERRNGLVPEASDIVYVARTGLAARGGGVHAGEGALCTALSRLGVRVIEPETLSLREQLAVHAGARTLIFAEGSAFHGRQLLGRKDQDIVILKRRPGSGVGLEMLECRSRSVAAWEVTEKLLHFVHRSGRKMRQIGLSFYDLDALFAGFGRLGLDLSAAWDAEAYRGRVEQDIAHWLDAWWSTDWIDLARSRDVIAPYLDRRGHGRHLAERDWDGWSG